MKHLFIFCLLAVIISGCDRDNKTDCAGICSDEFRIINVSIKRSSDNSTVVLTSFKVIRVSDSKDITPGKSLIPEDYGFYPLVDDNYQGMLRNRNVEVEFQGYSNNTLIVSKRFIVTADCCHVSLVSDESVIYI
jgi:hypothetical protein